MGSARTHTHTLSLSLSLSLPLSLPLSRSLSPSISLSCSRTCALSLSLSLSLRQTSKPATQCGSPAWERSGGGGGCRSARIIWNGLETKACLLVPAMSCARFALALPPLRITERGWGARCSLSFDVCSRALVVDIVRSVVWCVYTQKSPSTRGQTAPSTSGL